MIVSHKQTYNPKIDFVICRVLLNYLPENYDIAKLKACFDNFEKPAADFEQKIVRIKTYFAAHDVCEFENADIKNLFGIITDEEANLPEFNLEKNLNTSTIIQLVQAIRESKILDTLTLFKLVLLTKSCDGNLVPTIPYHNHCKNLYNSVLEGDSNKTEELYNRLVVRTRKYCCRHSIEENIRAVQKVNECAQDFIAVTGALEVYIYGSLGKGNGHEYSDIDIMAVFSDDCELASIKQVCRAYWSTKLSIPFDLYAITQSKFNKGLKSDIQKNLKRIDAK